MKRTWPEKSRSASFAICSIFSIVSISKRMVFTMVTGLFSILITSLKEYPIFPSIANFLDLQMNIWYYGVAIQDIAKYFYERGEQRWQKL